MNSPGRVGGTRHRHPTIGYALLYFRPKCAIVKHKLWTYYFL